MSKCPLSIVRRCARYKKIIVVNLADSAAAHYHFDRCPSIIVGRGSQRYVPLWPPSIYQKRPKLIRLSAKGLSKRIKGQQLARAAEELTRRRGRAPVILISRHATRLDRVRAKIAVNMHYNDVLSCTDSARKVEGTPCGKNGRVTKYFCHCTEK